MAAVASDGIFWVSKVLSTIKELDQDVKHVSPEPKGHDLSEGRTPVNCSAECADVDKFQTDIFVAPCIYRTARVR